MVNPIDTLTKAKTPNPKVKTWRALGLGDLELGLGNNVYVAFLVQIRSASSSQNSTLLAISMQVTPPFLLTFSSSMKLCAMRLDTKD